MKKILLTILLLLLFPLGYIVYDNADGLRLAYEDFYKQYIRQEKDSELVSYKRIKDDAVFTAEDFDLRPEDKELQAVYLELNGLKGDSEAGASVLNDLRESGLNNEEIADALSEMCHISITPENINDFMSKLLAYAKSKGELLDEDLQRLSGGIKSRGLQGYFDFASEKYGLNKEDAVDVLCVVGKSVIDAGVSNSAYSDKNSNTRDRLSELMQEYDTDLEELQSLLTAACGREISKEKTYELLEDLAKSGANLENMQVQNVNAQNLFSTLSLALNIPESDLKAYSCAD